MKVDGNGQGKILTTCLFDAHACAFTCGSNFRRRSNVDIITVGTTVTQRVRDRAHIIRLNAQGWNAPVICDLQESP
jgi:hypothetical protein